MAKTHFHKQQSASYLKRKNFIFPVIHNMAECMIPCIHDDDYFSDNKFCNNFVKRNTAMMSNDNTYCKNSFISDIIIISNDTCDDESCNNFVERNTAMMSNDTYDNEDFNCKNFSRMVFDGGIS